MKMMAVFSWRYDDIQISHWKVFPFFSLYTCVHMYTATSCQMVKPQVVKPEFFISAGSELLFLLWISWAGRSINIYKKIHISGDRPFSSSSKPLRDAASVLCCVQTGQHRRHSVQKVTVFKQIIVLKCNLSFYCKVVSGLGTLTISGWNGSTSPRAEKLEKEEQLLANRDAWESVQSSCPKGPEDSDVGLQDLEQCRRKAISLVLGQNHILASASLEKAAGGKRVNHQWEPKGILAQAVEGYSSASFHKENKLRLLLAVYRNWTFHQGCPNWGNWD